jgi:hypothetical protein
LSRAISVTGPNIPKWYFDDDRKRGAVQKISAALAAVTRLSPADKYIGVDRYDFPAYESGREMEMLSPGGTKRRSPP